MRLVRLGVTPNGHSVRQHPHRKPDIDLRSTESLRRSLQGMGKLD
jgi:hypothetical protein